MKSILWLFLLLLVYGCDNKETSPHRETVRPKFPNTVGPSKPLPSSERHIQATGVGFSLDGKDHFIRGFSIADPWHFIKRRWRNRLPLGIAFLKNHVDNGFQLGGNTLRVPLIPRDPYKEGFLDWHEEYLKEILIPLVNHVTKQGRYVILDNHHVKDWNKVERADLYLWADLMIEHFGNNPKVIFEVFNEPIRPDHWKAWRDYIHPTIDQFQKVDNLLLVGGPYWSSHMSGADEYPMRGKNIAYTGHIYSNQSESAWFKNYPIKRPIVYTEVGYEVGHKEGGDTEWATYFHERFLRGKSFIWWCYDSEWGPRMVKTSGQLTDAGKFYREIT